MSLLFLNIQSVQYTLLFIFYVEEKKLRHFQITCQCIYKQGEIKALALNEKKKKTNNWKNSISNVLMNYYDIMTVY